MARIDPRAFYNHPNGNFSFYSMRGVDRPIVRRKGGASKDRIRTAPQFEQTRMINSEFGGRAKTSSWIMRSLYPMKALADYNIAGPLNSLLKPIQDMDTVNRKGQRSVRLSQRPELLNGFSLNHAQPFDSIVRAPLQWEVDHQERLSHLQVPALTPRINFYPDFSYPLFCFVMTLGVVPDLFYSATGYAPSKPDYASLIPFVMITHWLPCMEGTPEQSLTLPFLEDVPDDNHIHILSIGLCYGRIHHNHQVVQVPRTGAAKIMGCD